MHRSFAVTLLLATGVATGAFAQSQSNNFGSSAFAKQENTFAKERGRVAAASATQGSIRPVAPVSPSTRALETAAPATPEPTSNLEEKAQERIAETVKNYVPKEVKASDIMPGASPSEQVLSSDSELSALDTSEAREARSRQGMATAPNNPYDFPPVPDAASPGRF